MDFSYEADQPYYALTDLNFSLTERVSRNWDVVARTAGRPWITESCNLYLLEGRTDRGRMYGAGLGHRLGDMLRVGLDVNYLVRRSREATREYDGFAPVCQSATESLQ